MTKYKRLGRCVVWTGLNNSKGYGRIMIGRKKNVTAHRAIYEGTFGKIPDGLVLDHLCRKPSCVNPLHLRVVTNKENVLCGIGITAQHAKKTKCPKGHPYDGINYRGARTCKTCISVNQKKYMGKRIRALKSGKE